MEKGVDQPYPVFAYLCSTIGETMDTYRFDIDESDLNDAVSLYTLYKGAKEHKVVLDAINDNPRAKLIEIEKFNKDASWDINLFWTDEEKEALGIKKCDCTMSFTEFKNALVELAKETESCKNITPSEETVSFASVKPYDLFTPKNGNSIYTKEYCKEHKGSIPLYSGNTEGVFDMVDTYDYDGEYLTWAKDGLAGYMMLHNGKFSLTGHRGILIPKENCVNIDLKYVKYVLEPIFRANKKGREGDLGKNEYTTLNSDMIKKMEDTIPIPIKEDGSFDLDKQKELAKKYEQIDEIKKTLSEKIEDLIKIVVI